MNVTEDSASILKLLNTKSILHKSLHQSFRDNQEKSSFLQNADESDFELKGNFMNIVEYINQSMVECGSQTSSKTKKKKIDELFYYLISPIPPIIKVDLQIQGAPTNLLYYYEGLAWFYNENTANSIESIQKSNHLRSTSSFSMIFAILFFKVLLNSDYEAGNSVQIQEGTLKTMLFLIKGIDRLMEDDVRHENQMFKVVFDQLKQFIFDSRFFLAQNSQLFDDYVYVFSRYFIYYFEESVEYLDSTNRTFTRNAFMFDNILENIYKLADVYQDHYENYICEEERASKEIEHSYIMLHIHKNYSVSNDDRDSIELNKFKARIVCIDLIISDTLKLMKHMQQQEAIVSLMHKFILFKNLPYMSKITQNKILNCFNDFSHPGGPYFPPRHVRQLATKIMSLMFPEGKKARKLVHNFFRLLHPYYWSQSVAFHSLNYAKSTFGYFGNKLSWVTSIICCRKNKQE